MLSARFWLSKDDAEKAVAARQLGLAPASTSSPAMAVSAAIENDLLEKTAGRKRSIRTDRMGCAGLKAFLGTETPLTEISTHRIGESRVKRLTERSERIKRPVTPASVNRDLSILRGLLRLAVHEWAALEKVPRIRFEREPEGRYGSSARRRPCACWPRAATNTTVAAIVSISRPSHHQHTNRTQTRECA